VVFARLSSREHRFANAARMPRIQPKISFRFGMSRLRSAYLYDNGRCNWNHSTGRIEKKSRDTSNDRCTFSLNAPK